jgi:hypothetical protein
LLGPIDTWIDSLREGRRAPDDNGRSCCSRRLYRTHQALV